MADEWSGPQRVAKIKGLVDSASKGASDFGKDRITLTLVDVTQVLEDDTVEELETRTLYVPEQGKPAVIFAASVRKVAGLTPKDKTILKVLEGNIVEFHASYEDFTTKDGNELTMTIYRVVSISSGSVNQATIDDLVGYLEGKTPAEAAKGRSRFAGTPYAAALMSKAETTKLIEGRLVLSNGRYTRAG